MQWGRKASEGRKQLGWRRRAGSDRIYLTISFYLRCRREWSEQLHPPVSENKGGYSVSSVGHRSNAFLWVRLQRLQEDIRCDRLINGTSWKYCPAKKLVQNSSVQETSPLRLVNIIPSAIHNNSSSRWSRHYSKVFNSFPSTLISSQSDGLCFTWL